MNNNKSLDMNFLKNKKVRTISTSEALKDVSSYITENKKNELSSLEKEGEENEIV